MGSDNESWDDSSDTRSYAVEDVKKVQPRPQKKRKENDYDDDDDDNNGNANGNDDDDDDDDEGRGNRQHIKNDNDSDGEENEEQDEEDVNVTRLNYNYTEEQKAHIDFIARTFETKFPISTTDYWICKEQLYAELKKAAQLFNFKISMEASSFRCSRGPMPIHKIKRKENKPRLRNRNTNRCDCPFIIRFTMAKGKIKDAPKRAVRISNADYRHDNGCFPSDTQEAALRPTRIRKSAASAATEGVAHEPRRRKMALIFGSSGALGSTVARYLTNEMKMHVIGADVVEATGEAAKDYRLYRFIHLLPNVNLESHLVQVMREVHEITAVRPVLNLVLCASGGWQGDVGKPDHEKNTEAGDFMPPKPILEKNAREYASGIERMRHMNLDPVISGAYISQHYLRRDGLFVVIGAAAALEPTPGMLGYGLAKAATNHLVKTLAATLSQQAEEDDVSADGRGAENKKVVIGILPTALDTTANRAAMPDSNFDEWTKPMDIAKRIGKWLRAPSSRPKCGDLLLVHAMPAEEENDVPAAFEVV